MGTITISLVFSPCCCFRFCFVPVVLTSPPPTGLLCKLLPGKHLLLCVWVTKSFFAVCTGGGGGVREIWPRNPLWERGTFFCLNVPTKGSTRKTRLWTCFFHVIEKSFLFIDCVCKPLHFSRILQPYLHMRHASDCFLIFENVSVEDSLHTKNELYIAIV